MRVFDNNVTDVTIQRFPQNSDVRPTEDGYYIDDWGDMHRMVNGKWQSFEQTTQPWCDYYEWKNVNDPVYVTVYGPIKING